MSMSFVKRLRAEAAIDAELARREAEQAARAEAEGAVALAIAQHYIDKYRGRHGGAAHYGWDSIMQAAADPLRRNAARVALDTIGRRWDRVLSAVMAEGGSHPAAGVDREGRMTVRSPRAISETPMIANGSGPRLARGWDAAMAPFAGR